MTSPLTTIRALSLASVLSLFSSAAVGQNALGDGRALDGNLSVDGPLNVSRPSFEAELRFRNAIATGNAPNGLSFRGDTAFTAPSEFRGVLGSNDLFSFRRDTLTSGLAGMGIRGTDALQFQMSLTAGSQAPANLVGGFVQLRSGSGASALVARQNAGLTDPALIGQPAAAVGVRPDTDIDADRRGLRSPQRIAAASR